MSFSPIKRLARAAVSAAAVITLTAAVGIAAGASGIRLELKTKNATILSSADRRTTAEIAAALDTFELIVGRISGKPADSSVLPTVVYVFAGQRGFEDFVVKVSNRQNRRLGGYVVQTRWKRFVVVDLPSGMDPEKSALAWRSLFLQEIGRSEVDLPIWLREGLSLYFDSFRFAHDRGILGRPPNDFLKKLSERSWLPLSRIETIDRNAPEIESSESVFPAQAWLITHFLLHQSAPRDLDAWQSNLHSFLAALKEESSLEVALEISIGIAAGESELRLRRHLEQMNEDPEALLLLTETQKVEVGSTRVLEEHEWFIALGDLFAVALESADRAEGYYLKARLADETSAASDRGLAYCAELRGDFEEAVRHYEASLDLSRRDPQTLRAYAAALLRQHEQKARNSASGSSTESDRQAVSAARALLEESIAIDPSHPEAHTLLGMSYLYTREDAEPGIKALRRAKTMLPTRPDIAANLAFLLAKRGSIEEADRLIAQIEEMTDDREMLERTRESLVAAKLGACEKFFAAGAWSDAENLLNHLRTQTSSPETIAAIDQRLEHVRHALVMESLYEELHRAIDLANFGAIEQAMQILDALREKSNDARFLRDIEKTRRDISPELQE